MLAFATFGYAASASVLLWLVDDQAASDAGIGSWDTVKVSYGNADAYSTSTHDYLNIGGQSSSSWGESLTSTQIGNIEKYEGFALADLSGITGGDANSQYYFIELYNGENLVGYTSTGLGGNDLSNYIKEWSDLSNMTQSMTGWGGAQFTAVPEPTSGMLMLLGMALLGLRRKKAV